MPELLAALVKDEPDLIWNLFQYNPQENSLSLLRFFQPENEEHVY